MEKMRAYARTSKTENARSELVARKPSLVEGISISRRSTKRYEEARRDRELPL
jgi:hypothetical protein